MSGDERKRFCGLCQKNVYNISDMSRKDAEELIREKEGQLCIRMYVRSDGTIISNNCPVGLRLLQKGVHKVYKGIAACFAILLSCLPAFAQNNKSCSDSSGTKTKEAQDIRGEVYVPPNNQGQNQAIPVLGAPAVNANDNEPRVLQGKPVADPSPAKDSPRPTPKNNSVSK
jgi:hypothetical protein